MKLVFENAVILILFVIYNYLCLAQNEYENAPHRMTPYSIGAIFDEKNSQAELPFKAAINTHNKFTFKYIFKKLNIQIGPRNDCFSTSKIVCNMMEEDSGVVAIFGPTSETTAPIVQSICVHKTVPHIQINWRPSTAYTADSDSVINFFPDADLLAQGLAVIVKNLQWNSFVILYENDVGLIRLQEVLKLQNYDENNKRNTISVRHLGPGPDYRTILKEIKNSSETQIILDCEAHHILPILQQAKELKLMEIFYKYFLTSLDAHTVDLSALESTANITTVRIFDPSSALFNKTLMNWNDYLEHYENGSVILTNSMITTETVLMHDATTIFTESFKALAEPPSRIPNTPQIIPMAMKCDDHHKWDDGFRITSYMKIKPSNMVLSGPIKFHPDTGKRTDFLIHLVYGNGDNVLGTWSPTSPVGFNSTRDSSQISNQLLQTLNGQHIIVASKIGAPYLSYKKKEYEGQVLRGDDQYEGYSKDLIFALSQILNFTFEFKIVKGYGQMNVKTKQWDGLIRELLDYKAHLAICDLTITHQRREVVDFSMPFMTLGISILYKTQAKKDVDMFAFLNPFSLDVWIYTATLYLAVSVILYFIARMAPGDWENPHPCEENPEELENIWDINNCLWLTLGSIMTQGCDILPKGISSRMATSMWWFFSLIMTSSYTANLAAFLTMERMEPTIDSAESLAKQTKIKYGTLDGGATQAFFRESNFSTYQRMWTNMISSKPSVFEKENPDGVKRVQSNKNGLYAFLMESAQIEYEVYTKCDLKQIGQWLDNKGFGIAMPINSAYRTTINTAVLKLQEDGELLKLKDRWWKEKREGKPCEPVTADGDSNKLALANVGGVFLVLGVGLVIAFVIAVLEFLWNVRNVSVDEHLSYYEALKVEVMFALNVWVTKKRTKPLISESSSSQSNQDSKSIAHSVLHGAGSFLNIGNVLNKLGTPINSKDS